MDARETAAVLEQQIDRWRTCVGRQRAIEAADVAELEDHLRAQIETLTESGLTDEEAFFVAARRLGSLDALSREFAREHSDRLWKQLVMPAPDADARPASADALVAFALAAVSGAAVQVPSLLGLRLDEGIGLSLVPFLVLPLLTAYFAWKRRVDTPTLMWIAAGFTLAAVLVIVSPFVAGGDTGALALVHLPIALLPLLGVAYTGGRWGQVGGRMDFVRFLGELCVYYLLIAAVGGLLVGSVAIAASACRSPCRRRPSRKPSSDHLLLGTPDLPRSGAIVQSSRRFTDQMVGWPSSSSPTRGGG